MLGQGARIRSTCFFCHQPVTVDIDGGPLHRAHPATIVVWDSGRDGSCVAEARCPLMNFFAKRNTCRNGVPQLCRKGAHASAS